jgi:transposase-like protein
MAQHSGSSRRERRHFSAAQKAGIVKAHLVDKVPVSDLCERHEITPNQFYQWQKQLFEGAAAAFDSKRKAGAPDAKDRRIHELQAKLANKNEVISELMEECVLLKKLDGQP